MIGSVIRRWLAAAIAVGTIGAGSAFAGLTDGGVHTPPNYYGFVPPARGGTYVDPVFGTTIKRISNAPATPDDVNGGSLQFILNEYATPALWNSTNAYFLLQHSSYFGVYDGSGNFLKNAPFDMHASTEPRWSRTDPNVVYYKRGNAVKTFNVATNAIATVRAFTEYGAISGRGKADIGFGGNKMVLSGDTTSIFVYDADTNTKSPVFNTAGNGYESLHILADDQVMIGWNGVGSGRYRGLELFDRNLNFVRQLAQSTGHMDVTRDLNGDPVVVYTSSNDPAAICENGITKIKVATGQHTCLLELDWSLPVHISTNDQGWAVVSTYMPGDPNPSGFWPPYTGEVFRVKLDGSVIERLVHHRSRPFNSYNYMPKASLNRDGTRITFSSNYGQVGGEYGDAYLINLGGAIPPAPTPTPVPTAGPTPTPGGTATPAPGSVTKLEQNHGSVSYTGSWFTQTKDVHSGGTAALAQDAGAEVTVSFTGTGITWRGSKDPWAGQAQVYLDGALRATIDTYSAVEQNQAVLHAITGLTNGAHTFKVRVLATMNVSASGVLVWADSFEITSGGGTAPTPTPTPAPVLGTPTLSTPTGTISTGAPTYTWSAVANASQYYLWVNGPAGNAVLQANHPASVCSGGTCSVTPTTLLANGTHRWWVQAKNGSAAGPWSAPKDFTVSASTVPPGVATLIGPSGSTGPQPSFTWTPVTGASEYYLWINNAAGAAEVTTWVPGSATCSGSTCSAVPSTALTSGGHTFWIQAKNSAGTGSWSNGMVFSVVLGGGGATPTPTPTATPAPGGKPGTPTLVSPSGNTSTSRPTYTWNVVSGATDYIVWVNNSAGAAAMATWYPASASCAGATCSVTPVVSLSNGGYTWWVQARNAAGTGPWSAGTSFTVSVTGFAPGAATLVAPSGSASRTPTYTWNAVGGATDYYLWVNRNATASAVVQVWVPASNACSGSTCSYTPGATLSTGSHTWWIQTRNGVGNGPWSAGLTFTAQ